MMGAPNFLTALPRWVLWRETKQSGQKSTKVPFSMNGGMASSTNSRDWSDYSTVQSALTRAKGAWDGAGITLGDLSNGEVLSGIDLDTCLNDDGAVAEWAKPYLRITDSYTEVSPSGQGLKILFRLSSSDLPLARRAFCLSDDENGRKRTHGVGNGHPPAAEIYFAGRYFTITENAWHETPNEVSILSSDALQKLGDLFGPRDRQSSGASSEGIDETECDAGALLGKLADAFAKRTGLRERWLGSVEGLTDKSRSGFDMSLGAMLKAAGFTFGEMRAALILNQHGAGKEKADDDRYFARIWSRTAAERPEPSPGGGLGRATRAGAEEHEDCSSTPSFYDPWDKPEPPPFPHGVLPWGMEQTVFDLSRRDGLDPGAQAMAFLAAASGAAHKGSRFFPYANSDWSVPPVLWLMILTDSGQKKTAVGDNAFHAIKAKDDAVWERFKERKAEWQALSKQEQKETPFPQDPISICVEDISTEKLQIVLDASSRGIMLRKDELVGFLGFGRYGKEGGPAERAFYLQAYEGGTYHVGRVSRASLYIEVNAVTLYGTIQPDKLAEFEGLDSDGLMQRMCIVRPKDAIGSDLSIRVEHRLEIDNALSRLAEIHTGRPYRTEAGELIRETEEYGIKLGRVPDYGVGFQGFCRKLHGLHARLAVVLHLLDNPDQGMIPADTIMRAGKLLHEYLLPQAFDFYSIVGGAQKKTLDIGGWILTKAGDRFVASDLKAGVQCCRNLTTKEMNEAVDPFLTGGWLTAEDLPQINRSWKVHPELRKAFSGRAELETKRRAEARELITAAARRQKNRA